MSIEKITSYLIHPIIFGVVATITYFILLPEFLPEDFKLQIIFIVFISTYIIPVLFLFLLKSFGSIHSFHLSQIHERKFPVFFFIILNLLLAYRLFQIPKLELLSLFFLSSTISLFIVYLFLLVKIKLSLHTLSLGLFTTFIALISYHYKIDLILPISFLILLSGYIAHVRLKLKAHTHFEVYLGYLIGVVTEISCYYFIFKG